MSFGATCSSCHFLRPKIYCGRRLSLSGPAAALLGKRELAQLNPFVLLALLTPSNAVQNAIIGDDNSVT
jgi:hypothetical protein